MERFSKFICLIGLGVIFGGGPALATRAERAMVVTDGAMVYIQPDFDAKVIAYLRRGTQVIVAVEASGPFRKVVVKKGVAGFISQVDIKAGARKPASAVADKGKDKKSPRSHRQKPVNETRYVGFLVGYVNYKEDIGNASPASNEITYGLKVTGANLFFRGPYLIDFNVAMHMGAPHHYNPGADITPTGFFMIIDMPMLMDFYERRNSMAYIGLGPHLNYSQFNVIYQKQAYTLQELRMGAVGVLGAGVRIYRSIFKLEGKYYWDSVKYANIQAGLQFEF